MTIAALPDAWLAVLPAPASETTRTPVAYAPVGDLGTLRQRVLDLAKGRRADEWGVLRRVAMGERAFRIEGGPGAEDLPLVVGVDDFLSKRVIWTLATEIPQTPPGEIGELFAASLGILRADVESLGASSRWTREHAEEKWIRASEKIETENAGARAFTDRITTSLAEGIEKRNSALPLVVQFDDRFYALDDRDGARYEGPLRGAALRAMLRDLWGDRRSLDVATKAGARPMTAAEIVDAYGRSVSAVVTEYAASAPRVDDLTLVLPPSRADVPEPQADPDVDAWLSSLDPSGSVLDWIAYARTDRCGATVPALALIGGAQVGKSLLADALARAGGARAASKLSRAVGRFGAVLMSGPILFSDEGLPRDPRSGVPLTEEFRALVTAADHPIELKGIDRTVYVRGGVRVVLAANRMDRLFANRGSFGAHDVAALVRRLCVVEIHDPAQIAKARALAMGLGTCEGDPARLERVARHFAWIQATRDAKPPAPRAGSVERELRAGGDLARASLEALEDAFPAPWIAVTDDTVWVQSAPWVARSGADSLAPIARALASYVTHPSEKRRAHPTTRETLPDRPRWIGLDRLRLEIDGVKIGHEA